MSLLTKEISFVYVGDVSFDRFAVRTRRQWYGLAAMLLKRYPAPAAVEAEDVVQVLLLAAWKFLARYDFARSADVGRYVQWNAIKKGRRYLLDQARRRDEKGAARTPIPVPISWLSEHEEGACKKALVETAHLADNLMVAQEERAAAVELSLTNCSDATSRAFVREFAHFEDLERASDSESVRNPALALTLRNWGRPAARKAARRAAEEAAGWQPQQQRT